jgi:hypothetical protein
VIDGRPMNYLYRYLRFYRRGSQLTDWEDKRLKRIFTHNELYFVSPLKLNDPFDCNPLFTFEGSDRTDFEKFFYDMVRHNYPNYSEKETKREVDSLIQKKLHNDPQRRKAQIET